MFPAFTEISRVELTLYTDALITHGFVRTRQHRITDILNGRRAITADTALRLGRYFGNSPRFWLDLQSQYDLAVVERERGEEIAKRVQPADAAA